MLFQLLALGDVDPAPEQPLQLPVGGEERHRPLPDIHTFAGQFEGAIGKDRLMVLQQIKVIGVHLLGQGTRDQIDICEASAIHLFEADAQTLLIATVAGNQSPFEVAHVNRIGDTVEQSVFERELIIELPLRLLTLTNLHLETTAPGQRHQSGQQRQGYHPEYPLWYAPPKGWLRQRRAQPPHTDRAQLGHRKLFQCLVQNTQEFGLGLDH